MIIQDKELELNILLLLECDLNKALAFWLSNEWGGGDAVFFAQME